LEDYLATDAGDAKIREELARFAGHAGDYAKAEKHLRLLLREHPDELKWRISLAQTLQQSGQLEEPVQIARDALAREPDNVDALQILLDNATFHDDRSEAILWLERLATADPDVRRLNKLGEMYVALGDEHANNAQPAAADKAYAKSIAIFRQARATDPLNADALLGMATALRLGGHYRAAIEVAEEALERHPSVARARGELYRSWLALGDLDRAEALLRSTLDIYRGNMRFSQELARVRFRKGDREAAIEDVKRLLDEPIRPSVPVLLYHGVSEAVARDAMPLENFRDQMQALKREGYSAISIHELLDFYENGAALPPRPVLITFDDARADSFRYADPVLREIGFKATMFVPVGEVGQHGPYNAVWSTIREHYDSGRWDMQCHSYSGHSPVPLDAGGTTTANFLTNRKWLEDKGREETREEFIARLDDDYRRCGEELKRRLPGLTLVGYAFPFGEAGQKTFSNELDALAINKTLATRYYRIGFIQDPAAEVTRTTEAAVLPRFEVPSGFSGRELLDHLRSTDAYTSTQLLLADLYSWDGRYAEANAMFDQVALTDNSSVAEMLARRGRVELWKGDLASARHLLTAATEVEPEHRAASQGLAQIDRRTLPSATAEGTFYADNRERSNFSVGPSGTVFLSDRVLLTASYRNKRFTDDALAVQDPPPGDGVDGESPSPRQEASASAGLEAAGHELTGELTYRWNWKTQLAVSAGVARFDERSATQAFGAPDPLPIGSAALNFTLGRTADVSLRATRTYVHAAGAVLDELGATGGEVRMQLQPLTDTKLDARYVYWQYDDSNTRNTVVASALQRVLTRPEIQVGYRFTFDHTLEQSPLFYTPDRYVGHDGVMKLSFKPAGYVSFGLEATVGAGQERGTGAKTQASILGNVRMQLSDGFSIYANGGSSQAADFRSSSITAGLSATF
jgi:tetratricopeptide (TPR) repeat protein